jgi:hypothetical protein
MAVGASPTAAAARRSTHPAQHRHHRCTAVVCWIWMVRLEGNGTTERLDVRGGWCGSAAEVLESHWLWADVQVEGGVEPDARRERRNGAFGGSGIAAREEST